MTITTAPVPRLLDAPGRALEAAEVHGVGSGAWGVTTADGVLSCADAAAVLDSAWVRIVPSIGVSTAPIL